MEKLRLGEISLKDYVGSSIALNCLIVSAELRTAKNNKNYAMIKVRDKNIEQNINWFGFDYSINDIKIGCVCNIAVKVQHYAKSKDGISLIADNGASKVIEYTEDAKDSFINKEDGREIAMDMIQSYIGSLEGYKLRDLVINLLNKNIQYFLGAAAGASFHHTGIGGLLVHTASVCNTAYLIADNYNKIYGNDFINKPLLISGALLHDIGKIKELEFNYETSKSDYSQLSILENHILIGIKMIVEEATALNLNNEPELDELIHLIASHHERPEFGSVMKPSTIEAEILAKADCIDAIAYRYNRVYKDLGFGEGTVEWTSSGKLSYFKPTFVGNVTEL